MRYRRYYVRPTRNGKAVDVVSVGPIWRGIGSFFWVILATYLFLQFLHYWYITMPVLACWIWLRVMSYRVQQRKKGNAP